MKLVKKYGKWGIRSQDNGKDTFKPICKIGELPKKQVEKIFIDYVNRKTLGYVDPEKHIPTLKEFESEYLDHIIHVKKKRSWKRDQGIYVHLKKYFKNKILTEILPKDIDNYKAYRSKFVTPATVNRELEILKSSINLADKWNKFSGKNPVSIAGLFKLYNKKERVLSSSEEMVLMKNSPPHLQNILQFALHTGTRKSEIIKLSWDQVDLHNNYFEIISQNAKSKKSRKIPLNKLMKEMLLRLKMKNNNNNIVFLNSHNMPYKRHDSINRCFKRATYQSGIPELRFHDLRHTSATRMIEGRASIVAVKEILGHADLSSTMRYSHPDKSLLEAVISLESYSDTKQGRNRVDSKVGSAKRW